MYDQYPALFHSSFEQLRSPHGVVACMQQPHTARTFAIFIPDRPGSTSPKIAV